MPNKTARRKALRFPSAIARDLAMQIVSERFKPGEILHGEVETSGRLQVSRAAYREAVRTLAVKGLVEALPKIGTRVTPLAQLHVPLRESRWRSRLSGVTRGECQLLAERRSTW